MNYSPGKRILSLKSPPVFDREHAPAWRNQALEALAAGQVFCEIDMESTGQMDSVGLASLLSIREVVEKRTGHVRLVNPSSAITQLLEVTRMHRYFEIATFRFESALADQRPILVIEDEPHIRTVTELVMKPLGRPVISAGDGEEGVKAAIRHHPAAILLDYLMPVMDGKETLKRLRSHPETQDIPVIIISANERLSKSLLLTMTAADAFISKPFVPAELRGEVHRLIQERLHKPSPSSLS
jgi:anti-anti-sigma factor